MRLAFAILSSSVLLALSLFISPASAGDYYGGGYGGYHRPSYGGHVWYSSSCCYSRVVRHTTSVRYVPNEPYHPHHHADDYYGRPYREGYYGRPYGGEYYGAPHRSYVGYGAGPRYYGGGYGYDAYNAAYVDTCHTKRVPVLDGRGGWVWGVKQVCG